MHWSNLSRESFSKEVRTQKKALMQAHAIYYLFEDTKLYFLKMIMCRRKYTHAWHEHALDLSIHMTSYFPAKFQDNHYIDYSTIIINFE